MDGQEQQETQENEEWDLTGATYEDLFPGGFGNFDFEL